MAKTKNKKKDIQDVIGEINKLMKFEVIRIVDGAVMDIPSFSSGSSSLNSALGIGGFPVGRQIEISGAPSVGKTHLAVSAMIEVQKQGGQVAYIDMESSVDLKRFEYLGLDTSQLLLSSPNYLEQGLDIIEMLAEVCDLIVYDSIGGSIPKAVYEASAEENNMGTMAKKLTENMPKISRTCEQHNCSVIWINQKRDSIGNVRVADSDATPGGHAFKHHMSIRLYVKKVSSGLIKRGEEILGHLIYAKVVKNKCAAPLKIAEIPFLFEYGICNEWSTIVMGEELGILVKNGSYFKDADGMTLGQGEYNATLFLKSNPEYYKQLSDAVSKKLFI